MQAPLRTRAGARMHAGLAQGGRRGEGPRDLRSVDRWHGRRTGGEGGGNVGRADGCCIITHIICIKTGMLPIPAILLQL